jgi:hypothetical protein
MQVAPASPRKTEAILTATAPFNVRDAATVVEGMDLGGRQYEGSR